MSKIDIGVEGESDRVILKEILKKLNLNESDYDIRLPLSRQGGKDLLYKNMGKLIKLFDYEKVEKIIFLVDYDNSEKDAEKFRKRADELQKRNPKKKIRPHFAAQKIESWLLGCYPYVLKNLEKREPDSEFDPVDLIENYERKNERKKRKDDSFSYNKISDGKKIAEKNELKHFECSESFKEFKEILSD